MSDSNNISMEVDEGETSKSVQPNTTAENKSVIAQNASPSVTVSLHPLVILNISEHWTRIRAQAGGRKRDAIMGALIGKQKGRNVEIMNSFELKFEFIDGEPVFNRDYYNTKEVQYKQVFSDLDFLGWYTTGDLPTDIEVKIHKQICQINESSILLLLEPIAANVDRLPITLYESISTVDTVQCETNLLFVPLQYTLATEEAERLGVDHVARMSNSDSGENSAVADHLLAQHSAIKMLHSRVKLVLSYIQDVNKGELPFNQEILREIYALSQRLPIVQNYEFREKFYMQCNEVGLIIYLGALTKGCNDVNQLVNKFNILYDRQGMGRRMRGLFF